MIKYRASSRIEVRIIFKSTNGSFHSFQ